MAVHKAFTKEIIGILKDLKPDAEVVQKLSLGDTTYKEFVGKIVKFLPKSDGSFENIFLVLEETEQDIIEKFEENRHDIWGSYIGKPKNGYIAIGW